MRRRSRAGPEPAKSRRVKTKTQKHRSALKTTRLRNSSAADHETQSDVAQLARERDEALEREKATAEVLHVISSSPGELEPVFQAMLANAMRICEAKFGMLFRYEQGKLRVAATHDLPTPLAEWLLSQGEWFPPFPGTMIEEMVRSKQIVYVEDVTAAGRFQSPSAKLGGARTIIDVPMLKH